jgi:hypothetical protein
MGTDGTFFLDWDIDETTSRLSPGFIPQPSETPPTAPNVRFTSQPETIHGWRYNGLLVELLAHTRDRNAEAPPSAITRDQRRNVLPTARVIDPTDHSDSSCPFSDHQQTITEAPICDLLLLTDCGENAGCHRRLAGR